MHDIYIKMAFNQPVIRHLLQRCVSILDSISAEELDSISSRNRLRPSNVGLTSLLEPVADLVLDLMRAHLSNPKNLQAVYQQFRPLVLEELGRAKNRKWFKWYLMSWVIPLCHESKEQRQKRRLNEANGSWDQEVVFFVANRFAEGGQPLIDEWIRIFADVAASLMEQILKEEEAMNLRVLH